MYASAVVAYGWSINYLKINRGYHYWVDKITLANILNPGIMQITVSILGCSNHTNVKIFCFYTNIHIHVMRLNTHIHTCTLIYTNTVSPEIGIDTNIHKSVRARAHRHTYGHTHARTHAHTHTHININTHTHIHAHTKNIHIHIPLQFKAISHNTTVHSCNYSVLPEAMKSTRHHTYIDMHSLIIPNPIRIWN